MAVLYRKYRPQVFADVVGQQAIVQTLKNQVKTGTVAHAYLFTGSRGVGKTTVARLMAKALNCPKQKNGEPCGSCDSCQQIAAGSFLDLVEIDAASNTGVDNIRELIEHVKFSPTVGSYKVFIIDEVHMLSKGAFNALLKTLEEPPRHAIFILATTEIQKLPATIISRTQRFDFKRLSKKDLHAHLAGVAKSEQLDISSDALDLIADLSEGGARDALSLLDKVASLGSSAPLEEVQRLLGITDIGLTQELVSHMLHHAPEAIPGFFEKLGSSGADFLVFNRDLLEYLRKLLVYKVTNGATLPDFEDSVLAVFTEQSAFSVSEILHAMRLFLRSFKEIPGSPSADLPVLLAAIEAASKKQEIPPGAQPIPTAVPVPKIQAAAGPKPESPAAEPVAEQAAEPTVPEAPSDEVELPLSEARDLWPALASAIKEINGPLASLVRKSPPVATSPGKIIVEVRYLFDKQNLENPKNTQVISPILEKMTGKKIRLVAVVGKEEQVSAASAGEALDSALQIFGGEVVE